MILSGLYRSDTGLGRTIAGNKFSYEISGSQWDEFRDANFELVPFTDAKPEAVWVDIETTGLDSATDVTLELGIILTDKAGRICRDGIARWLVYDDERRYKDWGAAIHGMPDFVRDMHDNSGLSYDLAELLKCSDFDLGRTHPAHVALDAQRWVESKTGFVPSSEPISGSSVHFDRAFLKADMPHFEAWFSYRAGIDVSALRETARKIAPPVIMLQPKPAGKHRTINDLIDSIRLYRHMLSSFLRHDMEIN